MDFPIGGSDSISPVTPNQEVQLGILQKKTATFEGEWKDLHQRMTADLKDLMNDKVMKLWD